MYEKLNTIVRKAYGALNVIYDGTPMVKHYNEEFGTDSGAHIRMITHVNEPTATEVGFNAAQQLSGYIQLGAFLPTIDAGLNWAVNNVASQVASQFSRKSFIEDGVKMEWVSVEREQPTRIGGHMSVTIKVHFRAFMPQAVA